MVVLRIEMRDETWSHRDYNLGYALVFSISWCLYNSTVIGHFEVI